MSARTARAVGISIGILVAGLAAAAQAAAPSFDAQVDAAAAEVLKSSGVPSASVSIIRDGKVVLVRAYGQARIEPPAAACARAGTS